MSYTYLAASGEAFSAGCYSDIPVFARSKSSRSAERFCCKDNATESCPASLFGTTCEHSTGDRGAGKSIAFAEASLAKTFPQRAKARESTGREAGYGVSSRVLLAKFDPATRSWKTRQCSLFVDLDECLETFPRWGMTQGGLLWELTMSERPTDASASGFWRTPDTGAGGEISDEKAADFTAGKTRASGSAIQIRLCDQVRHPQLWPKPKYLTPKATDKGYAESQSTFVKRNGDRTMNCYASLSSQVLQMSGGDGLAMTYPTPKCQDSRAALTDRHKGNLGEVIHGKYLNGGNETPQTNSARLNPYWVEWLMGWPIGWTDLRPLATDKFRSWRQQLLTF